MKNINEENIDKVFIEILDGYNYLIILYKREERINSNWNVSDGKNDVWFCWDVKITQRGKPIGQSISYHIECSCWIILHIEL